MTWNDRVDRAQEWALRHLDKLSSTDPVPAITIRKMFRDFATGLGEPEKLVEEASPAPPPPPPGPKPLNIREAQFPPKPPTHPAPSQERQQRCKVDIEATVFGFYNPEEESLAEAQDRITMEAEMAVNRGGIIRMHVQEVTKASK